MQAKRDNHRVNFVLRAETFRRSAHVTTEIIRHHAVGLEPCRRDGAFGLQPQAALLFFRQLRARTLRLSAFKHGQTPRFRHFLAKIGSFDRRGLAKALEILPSRHESSKGHATSSNR